MAVKTDRLSRLESITGILLAWYADNKRPLPWRDPIDPYHTWISEIMLQQTRIDVVIDYYHRFLEQFPDIPTLASASEDALLKAWEGLGYYNRVRNIGKAARMIMEEYGGQFPGTKAELMTLPGIGEYTAAAISSIVFGEAAPSVDGNVLRVTSRLLNDARDVLLPATRKDVTSMLAEIIPAECPGDFNQALMELGETICLPDTGADCAHCPCRSECLAFAEGTVADLPVRQNRMSKKTEHLTVFIIESPDGSVAVRKRPKSGLLAGMFEFPNTEGHLTLKQSVKWIEELGMTVSVIEALPEAQHIFTHKKWMMHPYRLTLTKKEDEPFMFVHPSLLETTYSMPSAFARFKPYLKGQDHLAEN